MICKNLNDTFYIKIFHELSEQVKKKQQQQQQYKNKISLKHNLITFNVHVIIKFVLSRNLLTKTYATKFAILKS